MIILDKPFVSEEIKEYLDQSQNAVLKNEAAAIENNGHHFNIAETGDFIHAYDQGERLYTISENSLDWIYKNIPDKNLINSIDIMKDKVRFRQLLTGIYPDFFFREASFEELAALDFDSLPIPFILKPSVGFFSVGVYTVTNRGDWDRALADIAVNASEWEKSYPDKVVGNSTFILEEYITGDEYAIDAYYDEKGAAVVLNIMKHDFSSMSDVSDRLYYTGKEIVIDNLDAITGFLNEANRHMKARNFPVHAEVRIKEGRIVPIEFNPMRFAGWCCTDLIQFAFGFRTYDYYFNNMKPDWETLLFGRDHRICALIVLDKPRDLEDREYFDYDCLTAGFPNALSLRKLDHRKYPIFGFLFIETDAEDRAELDHIISSDLTEYIKTKES